MAATQKRSRRRLLLPVLVAVVAVGAIFGYAFGSPLLADLNSGKTPTNILYLDRYNITSDSGQPNPTVLTLSLRNVGTSTTTLNTLTITDLGGIGTPATFQLNGQTIASAGTSTVSIDTLTSGFYFVHGHSYSFKINTPTAQFTFSPESYP